MALILSVVSSSTDAEAQLKKLIEDAFAKSSQEVFAVALSGGSLIQTLATVLSQLKLTADQWKKWVFYFADERIVDFEDGESTYGSYKSILMPAVPDLGLNQFVIINPKLSSTECAFDYYSKMKRSYQLPQDAKGFAILDLILLGMGPDGHTASLFPGHKLLEETESWIGSLDNSPKMPPKRVTFTLPLINAARAVVFVSTGASKSKALKEIFVDKVPLPAGLVKPANGQLYWIVDKEAASELPETLINELRAK
ncbi:6-phosphogluconolactonase [Halotydeus destructor]|nr:6-phosphogluconolactonase [Halotydeus destructor]